MSGMEDTLLEGDEAFDILVVSVGASDTATVTIAETMPTGIVVTYV